MTPERTAALATGWIEAWARMDMDWFRQHLALDFVHISPFGRQEGCDDFIATVEPLARTSVLALTVLDVVAHDHRAAVRYENHTPAGVVASCDWVTVDDGAITEVRSFYDTAAIRTVLTSDDQARLGGSDDVPPTPTS